MMNPLGKYGNAVAAIIALLLVVAAVASRIIVVLQPDPWLDNTALLAVGIVFGTQVVQNGTQTKATAALAQAEAANRRLDAANVPPALPDRRNTTQ